MKSQMHLLPCVERESAEGIRVVDLSTAAFSERKLFLFGEINTETLYKFAMQMLSLEEDKEGAIDIFLNSPGGEVNAGLAIYDLIQACNVPVNLYCIGMAASMGAVILAGGQKGRRFILPHSKVMIHEPLISGGVGGSASSIKSTSDAIMETKKLINNLLAKHTGKALKEINKATRYDNYMTAEEAVAFGICDEIVETIC